MQKIQLYAGLRSNEGYTPLPRCHLTDKGKIVAAVLLSVLTTGGVVHGVDVAQQADQQLSCARTVKSGDSMYNLQTEFARLGVDTRGDNVSLFRLTDGKFRDVSTEWNIGLEPGDQVVFPKVPDRACVGAGGSVVMPINK